MLKWYLGFALFIREQHWVRKGEDDAKLMQALRDPCGVSGMRIVSLSVLGLALTWPLFGCLLLQVFYTYHQIVLNSNVCYVTFVLFLKLQNKESEAQRSYTSLFRSHSEFKARLSCSRA